MLIFFNFKDAEFKEHILSFGRKKKISKDFIFIKLKAFSTCLLYTPIAYGIPVPEEEILKGNSE